MDPATTISHINKAHQKSRSPPDANFSDIHSGTNSIKRFSCSSTSPANTNEEDHQKLPEKRELYLCVQMLTSVNNITMACNYLVYKLLFCDNRPINRLK